MKPLSSDALHDARRALVAVTAAAVCAPAAAEPARYELDPEHVTVAFLASHIGFASVLGTFSTVAGSYVFDEETGTLSDVEITVMTASVTSGHAARDEHLRSDDFLDSRRFPTMTFTAGAAQRTGERTFDVNGELELLGQRRPLTLHATWNKSGDYPIGRRVYAMGVSARGVLVRSAFGMRYAVDNGWVSDEVEIIVEIEARRGAAE